MKPYYERDGITIYHGDCLDVLPALPENSVDVVVADPPFSLPVQYQDASDHGGTARSWGDLVVMEPFFVALFKQIRRTLAQTAHVYIHCDQDSYPVFYKAGYSLWPQSHLIVWYKATGRRGKGWLHSHELVLHLRTMATQYAEGFRQDVIGVMPVRTLDRRHPAQKPGGLCDFLFDGVAKAQPVVLDPFMGSGTTLVAARDRGWRAVGIEIEERYCEAAVQRLAQQRLPLFEEAAG